jgi:8-oxo-dGTP diphosphatase
MPVERHPIPAVGVVIVDRGMLLLVRRRRGAYAGAWAVPGGRQRFGESMEQAAIREAKEETGLDVEIGQPVWVGDIVGAGRSPSYHYSVVDFRATVMGGRLEAGDDAAEVRWVALDEAAGMEVTPTMHLLIDRLRAEDDDVSKPP